MRQVLDFVSLRLDISVDILRIGYKTPLPRQISAWRNDLRPSPARRGCVHASEQRAVCTLGSSSGLAVATLAQRRTIFDARSVSNETRLEHGEHISLTRCASYASITDSLKEEKASQYLSLHDLDLAPMPEVHRDLRLVFSQ
ncbi:unnamed protein product [Spodoptera exigua]|nr:unnamed protein product [Spodoptera exigua]